LERTRKDTAYHEAGHAAPKLIFQHQPDSASIRTDHESLGRVRSLISADETKETATELVVCLYAGCEAAVRSGGPRGRKRGQGRKGGGRKRGL